MLKHWYNVELPKDEAIMFRDYIIKHEYDFEISEAMNLAHFEVNMTTEEALGADEWLKENCK